MTIEYRMLSAGEESLLVQVAPDVFDHAIDRRFASEFLADPRHHLGVAIDAGIVVGFASAVHYVHPDKAPELWINEVSVTESHRRRGLAQALLRLLFARARSLRCQAAWVLTDRTNDAATNLYTSVGGDASRDHVMFTFPLE